MNSDLCNVIFSIYKYFGKDKDLCNWAKVNFYRIGKDNPRVALMSFNTLLSVYIDDVLKEYDEAKKDLADYRKHTNTDKSLLTQKTELVEKKYLDITRIHLIAKSNFYKDIIHTKDALSLPEAKEFYSVCRKKYPRSMPVSIALIGLDRFEVNGTKGKLNFADKLRVKYILKSSCYPRSFRKRVFLLNKNRIRKDTVSKKTSGLNKFFIAQSYKKQKSL